MKEELKYPYLEAIEEYDKILAEKLAVKIRYEFRNISEYNVIENNLERVRWIKIIQHETLIGEEQGKISFYVLENGIQIDCENRFGTTIKECAKKYYDNNRKSENYKESMLNELIKKTISYLKAKNNKEYWGKPIAAGLNTFGEIQYDYIILQFDKVGLERVGLLEGEKKKIWKDLSNKWVENGNNEIQSYQMIYDDVYKKTILGNDDIVSKYGEMFCELAAMQYEKDANEGNLIYITDEKFCKIELEYIEPVIMEMDNLKRIRKLLQMTNDDMALMMNKNGEIYAMGKIKENISCDYLQIKFIGNTKFVIYKNGELYLIIKNRIPQLPVGKKGLISNILEKIKKTFDTDDTSKIESVIAGAIKQEHGTTIIFSEEAESEAKRLKKSGISIKPRDISEENLVRSITSIDGALICDLNGTCYMIGAILDGMVSEEADLSRGARYNSAIRYVNSHERTCAVVVSEDGYVDCFPEIKIEAT